MEERLVHVMLKSATSMEDLSSDFRAPQEIPLAHLKRLVFHHLRSPSPEHMTLCVMNGDSLRKLNEEVVQFASDQPVLFVCSDKAWRDFEAKGKCSVDLEDKSEGRTGKVAPENESEWTNWKVPSFREVRVLIIISSKGSARSMFSLFEQTSKAISALFNELGHRVTILFNNPTTHEDIKRKLDERLRWDIIQIIAHTHGETPQCGMKNGADTEPNAWSLQWWAHRLSTAKPQVFILTCCESEPLKAAVLDFVGICVWERGTLHLGSVSGFCETFYRLLLKRHPIGEAFEKGKVQMDQKTQEYTMNGSHSLHCERGSLALISEL
jgi:hypothetical protein